MLSSRINMYKMTSVITPRATRLESDLVLTFTELVGNSWQSCRNPIPKT